ncbi:MAG TPA: heme ABC exporter ATP-binding protein CcmA [Gaiellales bacterium]|jgi:heme ABC exporter ATP-binding subunit CcmA|nr:heme ABC exporter ATP-binding protein CcmA [Gaiellales bacterium]
MSSPDPAIRCDAVSRRYGERLALDRVTLRVDDGERVLLTGGNGAGKTTLLRMLATVLRPHGGALHVAGHPLPREARRVRPLVGYLGHEPLVYPGLTAGENLELYAALQAVPADRAGAALELVGLDRRRGDLASDLSRGMRQRLALARAVLHRPRILLLDEPTTGLDDDGRERLRGLLAAHDGTAVISTHEPEWFHTLGVRRVALAEGRIA